MYIARNSCYFYHIWYSGHHTVTACIIMSADTLRPAGLEVATLKCVCSCNVQQHYIQMASEQHHVGANLIISAGFKKGLKLWR